MPKIIPVGPATSFVGKSLWEILGNLKNFGVGRIVKMNSYERYPEPSYFRILKVEALPAVEEISELRKQRQFPGDLRKVRAYTENVFRGRRYEKVYEICQESWKPDYVLVPKSEEKALIAKAEAVVTKEKVLPQTLPFPPLLKYFIKQDRIAKGLPVDEEPRMKIVVKEGDTVLYRVAKDGEKPTVDFGERSKNIPGSSELYEVSEFYKNEVFKTQKSRYDL